MNQNFADQKAIEWLLMSINRACLQGRLENLDKYFHSDMVIDRPEFREGKVGRDQCIQHHEDFLKNVKILSFRESDYKVNVWGDTAVASYQFEVQLEIDNRVHKESGRELYTFSRNDQGWQAVWSSIAPPVSHHSLDIVIH